ncbi:hypothetical protein GYMLUDRAFT_245320 [Collybiopsis luxurians FD-317 M1]|uniref:Uncharacterized protein n=1 Tax=Collybiopsis luxurians FD-317 M1 TaxID=944289 RepID=A0A0D0CL39_9AGAR|nr:hypothetical protein GYMLUDRAFT_245320 [Collybiopsis luxurians FD-317 M1]
MDVPQILGEQLSPNLPSMGVSTTDPLTIVHRRLQLFSALRPDFKEAKLTWASMDTRDLSLDHLSTKNWSAIQLRRCSSQAYESGKGFPTFMGTQVQDRLDEVEKIRHCLITERAELRGAILAKSAEVAEKQDRFDAVVAELTLLLTVEDELRDLDVIAHWKLCDQ